MNNEKSNSWLLWLIVMWLMIIAMRLGQISSPDPQEIETTETESIQIAENDQVQVELLNQSLELISYMQPMIIISIVFMVSLIAFIAIRHLLGRS